MSLKRAAIACIVLVVAYLLLVQVSPPFAVWFAPAILATVAACLIGRISLLYVFLVLAVLGPTMTLCTLFLVTGISSPGQAAENLRAVMLVGSFLEILAAPFIGSATWLAMRYLTIGQVDRCDVSR